VKKVKSTRGSLPDMTAIVLRTKWASSASKMKILVKLRLRARLIAKIVREMRRADFFFCLVFELDSFIYDNMSFISSMKWNIWDFNISPKINVNRILSNKIRVNGCKVKGFIGFSLPSGMKISASPRKEASWTDELQNMKQDVISKSRNSLEPEIPVLTLYFYCNVNIDFLFHIL
jgi:hypothetical protein